MRRFSQTISSALPIGQTLSLARPEVRLSDLPPQFWRNFCLDRSGNFFTAQLAKILFAKMRPVTGVVVGDAAVGKTCLLRSYVSWPFDAEYVPTVFDSAVPSVLVDGIEMRWLLWDSAGRQQHQEMRVVSYSRADVVLICFSLAQPASLENVLSVWVPELREHCSTRCYVLVGLQSDIRDECIANPRGIGTDRI
jgi:small GTP-binding protein